MPQTKLLFDTGSSNGHDPRKRLWIASKYTRFETIKKEDNFEDQSELDINLPVTDEKSLNLDQNHHHGNSSDEEFNDNETEMDSIETLSNKVNLSKHNMHQWTGLSPSAHLESAQQPEITHKVIILSLACPVTRCKISSKNRETLEKHMFKSHQIERHRCLLEKCTSSFRHL